MNEIVGIIDSSESFEELGNQIQSKDLIQKVADFLNKIDEYLGRKRTSLIKDSRLILASFLISRFPQDTLGTFDTTGLTLSGEVTMILTSESTALHAKSIEFVEQLKQIQTIDDLDEQAAERIVQYFRQFTLIFDNWKQTDSVSLKRALLEEYHNLSVQIMNEQSTIEGNDDSASVEDPADPTDPTDPTDPADPTATSTTSTNEAIQQRIEILEQCKVDLLETAKMLGGQEFADEILQYSPVVVDIEQLCAQYSNAFWDVLYEEFVTKKYDKIFVVLEHLVVLFGKIYEGSDPTKVSKMVEIREKIDIDFIKQRLQHDAYSSEEMLALCTFIMVQCSQLQAPLFDDVVEELKANLTRENFLPRFLREISIILQITTDEVLKFRAQEAADHDSDSQQAADHDSDSQQAADHDSDSQQAADHDSDHDSDHD